MYVLLVAVLVAGCIPAQLSRWHGNAELHTLLETANALLALFAAAMALVRYYSKKTLRFLLLGSAFVGAALLDGFHAVITSSFVTNGSSPAFAALTPWSGVISRIFLSLMMWLSSRVEGDEAAGAPWVARPEITVYLMVGASAVAVFLFFAFVPLPPAYYPKLRMHRPAELVAFLFFTLALIGYLRRRIWRNEDFEHWIVVCLIISALGHLVYMSFSGDLFDLHYGVAHALKIVGYVVVLVGLFANMFSIFNREQRHAVRLVESNQALEAEIAERRRAETALQQAHDELERRVQERTAELAQANEGLHQAQRLESIGRLAAGVAHEINTPIQYVGDNIRFLQEAFEAHQQVLASYEELRVATVEDKVTGNSLAQLQLPIEEADLAYFSEEAPKAIRQSLDGVERVATIVRAMKEFAHPGRKEKTAVDLNKALANALIVARNEIKYVAEVEIDFGELPPVLCHAAELNQVFLNLLINAADAIREVMKQSDQRGLIRVRTRRAGDQAEIAISDTGCGIPDNVRPHIFEPFFTTKEVGRGTGQGLAIARATVVTNHGGKLTFEPNGIRGTTFLISLPLESTT